MKHKTASAFTLVELLVVLTIIGVLAGMLGPLGFNRPATGTKVGQIVKLSQEGIIASTWEGELIPGVRLLQFRYQYFEPYPTISGRVKIVNQGAGK